MARGPERPRRWRASRRGVRDSPRRRRTEWSARSRRRSSRPIWFRSRSPRCYCWRRRWEPLSWPSEGSSMLLGPALLVSALLFTIGVAGVILRRNAIVLFMCVELMLNAVNLTFVALSQVLGLGGQVIVFFVMTVAAAEAAVGLAIILAIFRHTRTVDLKNINLLQG